MVNLPKESRGWDSVRAELEHAKSGDHPWKDGRTPLYIYYKNEDLLLHQCEAFSLYMAENVHGSKTVFPSVARLEREVCEMSLGIFNAPAGSTASFTSGGTESIFLAVKTARDWVRANRPRLGRPNLVIPQSAHPAFNKAAHYLELDVIRVPLDHEHRADVEAMAKRIDANTIMLVGSAPAYPHGVFDPIESLGRLALERQVWLHADACFGGFLAPFAKDLGYPIPAFDLAVPGVWSLSADLHKYGFAAKGASIVAYRDADLMSYQGFEFSDWARGHYYSPTFAGSRPAGAVATAWAMMQNLGREGYRELAASTLRARDRLVAGVAKITGIRSLSPCELSIVLIEASDTQTDMDVVAAELNAAGWFASRSSDPAGLHFTINPVHEPIMDEYLAALAAATAEARTGKKTAAFQGSTY